MAKLYIKEAALLFVLWVVYKNVQTYLRWRNLKKFGDKHGCGDAPLFPNKLPGGIERYAIMFKLKSKL